MKIQAIIWDLVEVTCQEEPRHNMTYREAYVSLTDVGGLNVQEATWHMPKSALYAKAKVLEMSPVSMRVSAYWWRSITEDDEVMMIPVEVKLTL